MTETERAKVFSTAEETVLNAIGFVEICTPCLACGNLVKGWIGSSCIQICDECRSAIDWAKRKMREENRT